MKKRLAVVLAALMMLSTTTFLAVESPNTNVSSDVATVTEVSDATVIAAAPAAATALVGENATVAKVVEVTAAIDPAVGYIDVPFTVTGFATGETLDVLHWNGTNWDNSPEVLSFANGQAVVRFTSLSPVAFVKVAAPATPATPAPQPEEKEEASALPPYNPNVWPWNEIIAREEAAKAAQNAATDATLPKTGAVAVLPFAAMACLAGAVVCGRKEK